MRKSKADRILLTALALLFLGFVFVIQDLFEQRIVDVGDKAPDFAVTAHTGKRITRSDFGGKVLVLNFWATWCPPCIEEMPSLNQFAQEFAPQGVVVLGVSVDKSESAYQRFVQQERPAFHMARDANADIPTEYGSFKWPETYIIDRTGKVRHKYIGPRNWTNPQIVNEVKALL
jgi:cytochrome c biogenesis protein CcmG, thiol:disulfide interchange protein DsbE